MAAIEALHKLRKMVDDAKVIARHTYFSHTGCCCVIGLIAKEVGLTEEDFTAANAISLSIRNMPFSEGTDYIYEKILSFGLDWKTLLALQNVNDHYAYGPDRKVQLLKAVDYMIDLEGVTNNED